MFSWSEKLATPVAQRLDRVLRPTNSARKVILYLLFALVEYHKHNVFSVCFQFCFPSVQCCGLNPVLFDSGIPDPGSQTNISESLVNLKFLNSLSIGSDFVYPFKN